MRKILFLFILLVGNIMAFEIKENNQKVEVNYNYKDGKYITEQNYSFDESSELLIKFNEETPTLISEFEEKYTLELKEVLVIGYYVYKSELSVIDLLTNIIDEENINSAKPNWEKTRRKK